MADRRILGLVFGITAFLGARPGMADRAHDLAAKAADQHTDGCEKSLTATKCHDQHPTGCTQAKNSRYDAYLIFLKNQTPGADLTPSQALVDGDFPILESEVPQRSRATTKDDCEWAGAQGTCWRASAWEVHPVTRFSSCSNPDGCDETSPDSDWTPLEDQ